MEYIIWAVFGILGQILMGTIMTEMLKFQKPGRFILVYSIITSIFGVLRVLFTYYNITEWNWIVSINIVAGICITVKMTEEERWKGFLAFSLTLAACMVSEMIADATYFLPKYDSYPYETGTEIYQLWMLIHYWILSRVLIFLWKKWITEKADYAGMFQFFIPMCLNMYLMIAGVFASYGDDHIVNNNLVKYLFPALLSMLFICYVLNHQYRKEQAEEELAEIEHQLAMERLHYQSIEDGREKTARFRHDFNNHLMTVRRLVENGETEEGKRMLEKMENHIKEEKATPNKM